MSLKPGDGNSATCKKTSPMWLKVLIHIEEYHCKHCFCIDMSANVTYVRFDVFYGFWASHHSMETINLIVLRRDFRNMAFILGILICMNDIFGMIVLPVKN